MEATINGARIHYERSGAGFPVVFLHAGYVAFVVIGQLAILAGIAGGWRCVRNRRFRFAHLAAMYALPYPQYSQLRFRRSASALVIHVAVGYELTFFKTRGRWQLTKLDYQQIEGD